MRVFSSGYEPLSRPAPLAGRCGPTLEDPDMEPVRAIQHAADNILMGVRGRRQMEEREARRRILEKQANPRGIGRDE